VTKGGVDPLLSAEENTATILEPPTEEEMNSAITKNMGHLLAVVSNLYIRLTFDLKLTFTCYNVADQSRE
jgi:hypothetical protein